MEERKKIEMLRWNRTKKEVRIKKREEKEKKGGKMNISPGGYEVK